MPASSSRTSEISKSWTIVAGSRRKGDRAPSCITKSSSDSCSTRSHCAVGTARPGCPPACRSVHSVSADHREPSSGWRLQGVPLESGRCAPCERAAARRPVQSPGRQSADGTGDSGPAQGEGDTAELAAADRELAVPGHDDPSQSGARCEWALWRQRVGVSGRRRWLPSGRPLCGPVGCHEVTRWLLLSDQGRFCGLPQKCLLTSGAATAAHKGRARVPNGMPGPGPSPRAATSACRARRVPRAAARSACRPGAGSCRRTAPASRWSVIRRAC